jgi:FKBP-type peptidyl-prolyl cis-trans isomerase
MRKPFIVAIQLVAAGTLMLGNGRAQQTPAATPQQPPAAKPRSAPAAGTQKAPAQKTGQNAKTETQTPVELKTQTDKISYALGMNLGVNLHKQSVEVDPAIVLLGLKDGLADGKTLMTVQEAQTVLTQLTAEMRSKQQEMAKQAGDANKKEGQDFLAANKTKEGVVTLPSGLQYKILTEGTGSKPTATDSVSCNYRGTLINGKEFDSSYKRGQPTTFPVNGVIKGWTEALQLMPVGSKWELFIPPDLAYGDRGNGPDIGPSATLVFEVELVSIVSKDAKDNKNATP